MTPPIIPCTHTGSLPRPDELVRLMFAVADDIPVDQSALDEAITKAILRDLRARSLVGLSG